MKYSKINILDEFDWLLERPTIYLGSTTPVNQEFFFSDTGEFRVEKYTPALHKLFEEIIENSMDEFIRTKGKFANNISVTLNDDKSITIEDNGRGLEIEKHHQFKDIYIPEIIFTHLRSGSNFENLREGAGTNGVGSVLTTLFSEYFKLKTFSKNRTYTQEFKDMLKKKSVPDIKDTKSDKTGTIITFKPNFKYFNAEWNEELLKKKVIDLAFCYPGIKFKYNGKKIQSKKYKDYIKEYSDASVIEESDRCKLIVSTNESSEIKHHSTVNGALTFQGGSHMDYIYNEIILAVRPKIEKKYKVTIKPIDIRNHISVFCQLSITNPIFSSQTKEKIINQLSEVKSIIDLVLTDKFYRKLLANDTIIKRIGEEAKLKKKIKDQQDANQKQKQILKRKVIKLRDANGKDREKCILFLAEGDSAASANEIRDTKVHAFLPLKGKVLNVHNLNTMKVLGNKEIQDILNSVGLIIGQEPGKLRYGKIVLLTDADPDGDAIKGLLINFFYKYWPSLFEDGVICFLKTPLYVSKKGSDIRYIYTQKEFDQLKADGELEGTKIKYYKGLGSMSKDTWDYCLNKNPQYITVNKNENTVESLKIAFGEDASLRKIWLKK